MGLLDKLLGRSALPASTTCPPVTATPGPRGAHAAWDLVRAHAQALDPKWRLVGITSGTDLRPDGRSATWEFVFDLPGREAMLLATLAPPADADPDTAAPGLTLRVRTGRASGAPLPVPFRDSPEVVAGFAAEGVDFVAGPTDMKLEARVLASGPAWITFDWNGERHAAFAA